MLTDALDGLGFFYQAIRQFHLQLPPCDGDKDRLD
jgi:hypothetical protein